MMFVAVAVSLTGLAVYVGALLAIWLLFAYAPPMLIEQLSRLGRPVSVAGGSDPKPHFDQAAVGRINARRGEGDVLSAPAGSVVVRCRSSPPGDARRTAMRV